MSRMSESYLICVCLASRIKKLLLEEIMGGAAHIKQFHSPHLFWVSELIKTNLVILSCSNQTRLLIGVKICKRQMRKNVRNVAWLFWKATPAMVHTSVLLGMQCRTPHERIFKDHTDQFGLN